MKIKKFPKASSQKANAQLRATANKLLQKQYIVVLIVALSIAFAGNHYYEQSLAATPSITTEP